jgi:hypothetical protein
MAHAPGCGPADYVTTDATPEGFEWRALGDVRVGDLDQFDREVVAVVAAGPNRVRIACAASATTPATLPVERMATEPKTSRGLYRTR